MGAFPIAEQQISGVRSNSTPEGVMLTKLAQGGLIKVSMNSIDWYPGNAGSATSLPSNIAWGNNDGSASGINMNVAAGLGTNITSVRCIVNGTIIAVRWRRTSATVPFSVVVDGISFLIPQNIIISQFLNFSQAQDREGEYILPFDFADGPHSVQIILYPDAAVAKTLVFYGFSLEARVGYKEEPRVDVLYGGGTLTTAAVALPTADPSGNLIKSVKQINYINAEAGTTITVLFNNIPIWNSGSLAAGVPAVCSFTSLGVNLGGATAALSHKVSAITTTGPTFILTGGQ